MRTRAKTDGNQKEIVLSLRQLGFSVLLLHQVGKGCPDLLVGKFGHNLLVELKTDKGTLTKEEEIFLDSWNGCVLVAKTVDEVIIGFDKLAT